ncbi:MAG: AMP-binding protein [Bacteroidia bacterium]|nr:AMP-binding protein [Bacteroidia bacterium]
MEKKIWHDKYPAGVSVEVDVTRYQSVAQILDECFEKYADQTAYINMGASLTFGEVDKLSRDFAAYLQNLGLEKGDRIALQMPNILQYPIALFGAVRAGLIVVNTNPLYTAREMKHQFKDSGAKAIVILDNFASKLDEIISDTDIEHVILTRLGDLLGGFKGFLTNFVVKYIKKMVPAYSLPTATPFKQALAIGSDCRFLQPEIKSEDVGFLQYTGGTTGVSKGATLSHGNLVANMLVMEAWNGGLLQEKEEIIITALPLYHIFAFTINCLAMVSVGGTNVLITNPRDMKGFLKEISKYKFTVITGVNTLFNGMLNHPGIEEVDFSNLKLAAGGGMAVQVAVNDAWKARTGKPILEGYGLSETSPVLSTNPNDGTDQIGTIGVPIPNTDMKILDDQGNEVAIGERGEICAKGPQVMRGYWNKLDENENYFFPGGWFRTGDIGIMREDGFFKIVDRKKDMILVSGFNVFPNEIEDVVAHHPGVLEVAAIGVPDEKSTEAVKIFVVKKDPAVTVEDLRAYCKENLTAYKVPKHVEFRDELPKSNVGKIIRRKLKEE